MGRIHLEHLRQWLQYYALELKVGAFIIVVIVAMWFGLGRAHNVVDRADWVQCEGLYAGAGSARDSAAVDRIKVNHQERAVDCGTLRAARAAARS